jgi:hypothetical protein
MNKLSSSQTAHHIKVGKDAIEEDVIGVLWITTQGTSPIARTMATVDVFIRGETHANELPEEDPYL